MLETFIYFPILFCVSFADLYAVEEREERRQLMKKKE